MTETTPPDRPFVVTGQTIHVTVSGQPDIENRFGPGWVRPDSVRISYRGHHMDARIDGRWVRENRELTTERLDQHYSVRTATDIVAWPDWLCALATLLRPAAATVPASAPTDWIDGHPQLEAVAATVWERCGRHDSGLVLDDPRNIAVAALAAVSPAPTARCPHGCDVSTCPCLACEADQTALRDRIAEVLANTSTTSGFTGISLAGRWECGNCGATGDGWYDEDNGLTLHDENGQPFTPDEHVCGEG